MDDYLAARVGRIIPRYSMLSPGDRVGVAVSGGADSVVLLHILSRLSRELGIQLKVLHVNHLLRGSESEADEVFVRELANTLGVGCLVDRPKIAEGNLEQEARLARRDFYARCRTEHALSRIALGHTRSDQAETVLFRLIRGAGLAGLSGMKLIGDDGLIRPLLTTSRSEIRRWAEEQGIRWREDSSNAELGFARNRLRNEVIPSLAMHLNSNIEGVLAAVAELAQDEEAFWQQQIEPIFQRITKRTHLGLILRTEALATLHIAVRRRIIRRALLEIRGDLRSIDLDHVEAILRICESHYGHDRVMVPGVDVLRSFESLLFAQSGNLQSTSRHYQIPLNFSEPCELPFGAGSICVNRITLDTPDCANFKEDRELSVEVADLKGDVPAIDGGGVIPLCVRNWEPGDKFQRAGHGQPQKIKTLFQEGRVLLWERRHWPVVVAGDEIIWVRRFGAGVQFAASPEDAHRIRITYRKSGG